MLRDYITCLIYGHQYLPLGIHVPGWPQALRCQRCTRLSNSWKERSKRD
jgi:hypothetical protein